LFRWRKKKLTVDLGGLADESEVLAGFLRTNLGAEVASDRDCLRVDSEETSPEDLKKLVSKFVYHHRLNNKYWVALEGGVVKISRFKEAKKSPKRKKEAIPPSTIKHGW